jgi:hypothetical protein
MSISYYTTAQICLNGHVVTRSITTGNINKFCKECGEKVISECLECNSPIRGNLVTPGVLRTTRDYHAPGYCFECGTPFPWTVEKLTAAKELAEILDELTEEDREALKQSLDDLVKDGPRTTVATTRFKRIISKTGPEVAIGFKDILVDVVSETVKKAIWGQ